MEIKDMNLEEVEARSAELDAMVETSEDTEAIAQATEERAQLNERKAILKDIKEYRNSEEYINAFAEYLKSGDDTECRALLSTNVGAAGEVAVPDMVSSIIKTDWLQSEILGKVQKISVAGNYKQQFELTAGDAVIHNEGSGAVSEEELTFGTVELIPESIKKWKIVALPTSATSTSVNAKVVKAGAALGTIATALGQLNAEARNPVVVMNPATKAAFKAAVYAGQFNADPFENIPVILTNNLPAISSASENDTYAIVGDFGYGALANFPKGQTVQIKIDDRTNMKSDLVDILGREYVAVAPVACRAFVKITKPAAI